MPYLATLPPAVAPPSRDHPTPHPSLHDAVCTRPLVARQPFGGSEHALWWSAAEVEGLRGTCAHSELRSLLLEVEEVGALLREGALSRDAARHGADAVDGAVRAAYESILSRAFGADEDAHGAHVTKHAPPAVRRVPPHPAASRVPRLASRARMHSCGLRMAL